jgi:diguanylate cyclase (GGDEF)-like protein
MNNDTRRKLISVRMIVIFIAALVFCSAISATILLVSELWALIAVSLILSMLFAAIVHNNHELRKLKDKLEALSNTDPLTGIYNRRYFIQAAAAQMNRVNRIKGESFIILLDLDHFKKINDDYGHPTGDVVLQETTERISAILRPYDVFARYGGEEFIILVTDINKQDVIALTERVRQSISANSIQSKGQAVSVTASCGIAPAAPVNELEAAIALADSALYQAKNQGRDRGVFSQ